MNRLVPGLFVIAVACAPQQVRKASDASADAKQGKIETAPGAPDAGAVPGSDTAADATLATSPLATSKTPDERGESPALTTAPRSTIGTSASSGTAARPESRPEVQATPIAAPTVTRTESGVGLLELPANDKAIVNIQLRFQSGAVDDPPGKAGITYLTARVMAEGGTKALDAKALLNALFPLAAELEVRVDKELTTFSARVHRDNLGKLLPIISDVLLNPRWDPAEFRRLREAAVNDVEKRLRQGDDENLGKETLWSALYRNHPYGRLTLGHISDLKSLRIEDLQAHAQRVFTADRLTVGVSGGYPAQLGTDLAKLLGALPKTGAQPVAIPQAHPQKPRIVLVEKVTDSTAISLGMPWALSHKDADWAALSVARSAFGEHRQFNGRLMQRLREARGLNYGDYAYIEHFQQEGGDAVSAQTGRARHQQELSIWLRPVQNENRLFALRAALYELQRSVKEEPFTAAEVEQTKGFLDGYILLFDQTDMRRLGFALDDAFYGMSGFLGTWRAQLRGVTADQVNAAWRKWIDPSKLEIAMVGPGMDGVKKTILEGTPTPMSYQKDAQGNVAARPKAISDADAVIEKLPLGARTEADVQVVPVSSMFE